MEEKKLTDEEIINDLQFFSNLEIEEAKKQRAEKAVLLATLTLDLIHRLQADNIQLKWNYIDLKERYVKVLGLNEKVIAEQKAEIERLTAEINQRREMMSRMDCNYATELQKNAELQKQVDESKEQRDVFKNLFENCNNSSITTEEIINAMNSFYREQAQHLAELKIEQAVKDTAREVLQGFDKWLKQAISDSYDKSVKGSYAYEGGRNRAFHEVKKLVKTVAESKGVEVE